MVKTKTPRCALCGKPCDDPEVRQVMLFEELPFLLCKPCCDSIDKNLGRGRIVLLDVGPKAKVRLKFELYKRPGPKKKGSKGNHRIEDFCKKDKVKDVKAEG